MTLSPNMVKPQKENTKVVGSLISLLLLSLLTVTIQQRYATAEECNEHCQFGVEFSKKIGTTKDNNEKYAFAEIDSDGAWSGSILDAGYTSATKSGSGSNTIAFQCSSSGIYSLAIQKQDEFGNLHVKVVKKGSILKESSTDAAYGIVSLAGQC